MCKKTKKQGTDTVNQGTDNIKESQVKYNIFQRIVLRLISVGGNEAPEPQAKYNRLQRIGLSLAAIFAAAVCVYICGNKVFDNKLIITIFSITAILFALIFYGV